MDSVAVERATISIYLAGSFSQNPNSATEGLTPLTPSSWRVFHFVGHLAQIQPNTLDAFPLLLFRPVQINSLDLTDQTAEAVRPLNAWGDMCIICSTLFCWKITPLVCSIPT